MTNGYNTPIGVPIGLPSILSLGLPPLVNPYPTLNLDFINNPQFDSRITFSRGSQATLFDSTGTLVYAKHNLLLQSQTFQTTWSALNVTVSTDTSVAPDGTTTADTLTPAASTAAHLISQSATIPASVAAVASVYVKTDGAPFVQVVYDNGASVGAFINVNLADGSITRGPEAAGGATNVVGSVINVGNGFYRIIIGATHTGTIGRILISPLPAGQSLAGLNPSTTTAVTDKVIVWGAQLNLANMEGGVTSSLTTYYPTTTAAYYAPRFDYNPSTLQPRGLLIEEQRTNSIRNNTMQGAVVGNPGTDPTNWSRSASPTSGISNEIVGTGTESGITYIDLRFTGTATATIGFSINLETSSGAAASASQTWTTSTYAKLQAGSLNGSTFQFVLNEYSSVPAFLRNTFSSTVTPTTAALNTQRSTFTVTTGASTAFVQPVVSVIFTNGQTYDFTLRIGLPQLEQGAFATSVIHTTTTALTRNADVASMTGTNFSSWYNQTEGSFVMRGLTSNATATKQWIAVDDGSSANRIRLATNASRQAFVDANVASVSQGVTLTSNVFTLDSPFTEAIRYALNDAAVCLNGGTVATDTSFNVPTVNRLGIGSGETSPVQICNGWIARLAYYPVRLQASQLQALTA